MGISDLKKSLISADLITEIRKKDNYEVIKKCFLESETVICHFDFSIILHHYLFTNDNFKKIIRNIKSIFETKILAENKNVKFFIYLDPDVIERKKDLRKKRNNEKNKSKEKMLIKIKEELEKYNKIFTADIVNKEQILDFTPGYKEIINYCSEQLEPNFKKKYTAKEIEEKYLKFIKVFDEDKNYIIFEEVKNENQNVAAIFDDFIGNDILEKIRNFKQDTIYDISEVGIETEEEMSSLEDRKKLKINIFKLFIWSFSFHLHTNYVLGKIINSVIDNNSKSLDELLNIYDNKFSFILNKKSKLNKVVINDEEVKIKKNDNFIIYKCLDIDAELVMFTNILKIDPKLEKYHIIYTCDQDCIPAGLFNINKPSILINEEHNFTEGIKAYINNPLSRNLTRLSLIISNSDYFNGIKNDALTPKKVLDHFDKLNEVFGERDYDFESDLYKEWLKITSPNVKIKSEFSLEFRNRLEDLKKYTKIEKGFFKEENPVTECVLQKKDFFI